jgi:hypothetical protein
MKLKILVIFAIVLQSCITTSPQHRYDFNTGVRLGNTSKINLNLSNTDCSTYIYSLNKIYSGSMWIRIPCDSVVNTLTKKQKKDKNEKGN